MTDDADSSYIGLNYLETSKIRMFLENRKMKKIWAPKSNGVMYPMSQIPPDKKFLPSFTWFDYIRPLDKDDIFNWRGKKGGSELKPQKRREAPLQHFATPAVEKTAEEVKASIPEVVDETKKAVEEVTK